MKHHSGIGAILTCCTTIFLVGCTTVPLSRSSTLPAHFVSGKTDGPYLFLRSTSSVQVLVETRDGDTKRVVFRGVMPTGNKLFDDSQLKTIDQHLRGSYLYLWRESIQEKGGAIHAVVLLPTVRFVSHDVDTGKSVENIAHFLVLQAQRLEFGEVLLDTSDSQCPLYKEFLRCERVGKREKNGFWKAK